jgi:hypothetical protein
MRLPPSSTFLLSLEAGLGADWSAELLEVFPHLPSKILSEMDNETLGLRVENRTLRG